MAIAVDRGRIATLRHPGADTSAGPAAGRVLLVPGFTGSKEDFLTMLEPLALAGYDVAAIDQLGQHESQVAADCAAAWGEDDAAAADLLASELHQVSLALWPRGPRPHVVAHSMGGLIARRAAIAYPDFLSSLILLGSGPAAIPQHQRPPLELLRQLLPDVDLADIWQAKRLLDAQSGAVEPAAEIQAFLERRWLANSPHGLRAKAGILLAEPDLTDELRASSVPVSVMFGTDDDVWWPQLQREMAAGLGVGVEVFDGAGHSPNTECPAEVVAALTATWQDLATHRTWV